MSSDSSTNLAKGLRIEWWVDHRERAVRFLHDISSHHEPAVAKQLEVAAHILQRELDDALLPLQRSCLHDSCEENQRHEHDGEIKRQQALFMHRAELIQREFIKTLEPVAFKHLGLVGEAAQIVALDFDGVFNPQRLALLNKMLVSTDARVRTLAAAAAIRSKNERLVSELKRGLLDDDVQLAHTALAALCSIRPEGLSAILREAHAHRMEARHLPDKLRRQIVFAAAAVADPGALEILHSAYLSKDHEDAARARWAAVALARIEKQKMLPGFIVGLESPNPNVVRASIAAVKFLHATRARHQLENLAASSDPNVRDEAAAALQTLKRET